MANIVDTDFLNARLKMEKSLDYKGRWRNHTVAFRVSDEEAKLLNDLVALSGLTKQDYITRFHLL